MKTLTYTTTAGASVVIPDVTYDKLPIMAELIECTACGRNKTHSLWIRCGKENQRKIR